MTTWTFDDIPDQTGRSAIVTGANSGIGFETARALARKGARVTLACRSLDRGVAAKERILAETPDAADAVSLLDQEGHLRNLAEIEKDLIVMAIDKYDGQMSEVARRLGIGRSTLYRKVQEQGIEVKRAS